MLSEFIRGRILELEGEKFKVMLERDNTGNIYKYCKMTDVIAGKDIAIEENQKLLEQLENKK